MAGGLLRRRPRKGRNRGRDSRPGLDHPKEMLARRRQIHADRGRKFEAARKSLPGPPRVLSARMRHGELPTCEPYSGNGFWSAPEERGDVSAALCMPSPARYGPERAGGAFPWKGVLMR